MKDLLINEKQCIPPPPFLYKTPYMDYFPIFTRKS